MSSAKTYTGGCHCGKVRFEVATDLGRVMSCNCSICSKTGALLTFVKVGEFKLLSGADDLTEYQFNRKVIQHLFCPVCGVESFAGGKMPDGTEMRAVNVRCLDGVDLPSLTLTKFDGKSM